MSTRDPHVPRSGRRPHAVRAAAARKSRRSSRSSERSCELAPRAVVTCARGSSDHAATYAKYLVETRTGLLASSAAPSVSSVYASRADLEDVLFLAISQSGASPDLLASAGRPETPARCVVALVNAEDSPLARVADHTVPLRAGAEDERRRNEVVHRLARRDRAPRRGAGPRTPNSCWRSRRRRTARARVAARLERRGRASAPGRAVSMSSAAGSDSASRRKPRSSSRRPAGCTPRRSVPPRCGTGRWRWCAAGFPVLVFAQHDETREASSAGARAERR